jgi:hypothetical protein
MRTKGETHLQNIVTHLKYNNMFHPQILLYKVHPFRLLGVLECILVVAIQSVHDVPLKMLQQVDLSLEVFGILRNGMALADVDRPVSSR